MSLDQHFKKVFDEAKVEPPKDAWKNIESQIHSKNKTKLLPIWLKRTGIAAAILLLGIYVGKNLSPNKQPIENQTDPIVNLPNNNPNPTENNNTQNTTNILNKTIENQDDSNHWASNHYLVYGYSNQSTNNQANNANNPLNTNQTFVEPIFSDPYLSGPELEGNPLILSQSVTPLVNPFAFPEINSSLFDEDFNGLEPTNELELAIAENQKDDEFEEEDQEFNRKKFRVGAYYGPLLANSFSDQALISAKLNDFEQTNPVTTAYGVQASFALNDKLSIRGGVGIMNLEQESNNIPIEFVTSIGSSSENTVQTINYQGDLQVVTERPVDLIVTNGTTVDSRTLTPFNQEAPSENGILTQNVQYIEIPLELEYALLKSGKFSLNANAGGSAYFLTENSVNVTTDRLGNQTLGEANNLNNTAFSTNAGLQLNYNVNKNLELNLQPRLRYLLNATNDTSDNNPVIIGVGAGVNFKF